MNAQPRTHANNYGPVYESHWFQAWKDDQDMHSGTCRSAPARLIGMPGSLVIGMPGSLVIGMPGSLVIGMPGSLVIGMPGSLVQAVHCFD